MNSTCSSDVRSTRPNITGGLQAPYGTSTNTNDQFGVFKNSVQETYRWSHSGSLLNSAGIALFSATYDNAIYTAYGKVKPLSLAFNYIIHS